jgi:hypothetical protein
MIQNQVAQTVQPGDLVDFGNYGALYVVAIFDQSFWVTDNEADRFNPTAKGWYVNKASAVKVLEVKTPTEEGGRQEIAQ